MIIFTILFLSAMALFSSALAVGGFTHDHGWTRWLFLCAGGLLTACWLVCLGGFLLELSRDKKEDDYDVE